MTKAENEHDTPNEATQEKLLTPAGAALLKGVARTTVYKAVADGTLSHVRVLGRIGLREVDVLAWSPSSLGGARHTKPLSQSAKDKISKSQKNRWTSRKTQT